MDKYIVVVSEDFNVFVNTVNSRMDDGYYPHGSMIIYDNSYYCQPMIKRDSLRDEIKEALDNAKVIKSTHKPFDINSLLLAFQAGFIKCESGVNIQKATDDFEKLFNK